MQVDPSLAGWTGEAAFARGAFAYVDELGRRGNLDELQTRLATVRKRCKVLRTANEVCSFSAHVHIAACCVWGQYLVGRQPGCHIREETMPVLSTPGQ